MNSNKTEIYGLIRFQLHMHAVKIPEQVHVYSYTCRAYRGCHGEARGSVGIEEHLPWSAFACLVHGLELVGVNGGAVVRFAGVVGEGGLGVGEQGAHEHRVSLWMHLG